MNCLLVFLAVTMLDCCFFVYLFLTDHLFGLSLSRGRLSPLLSLQLLPLLQSHNMVHTAPRPSFSRRSIQIHSFHKCSLWAYLVLGLGLGAGYGDSNRPPQSAPSHSLVLKGSFGHRKEHGFWIQTRLEFESQLCDLEQVTWPYQVAISIVVKSVNISLADWGWERGQCTWSGKQGPLA